MQDTGRPGAVFTGRLGWGGAFEQGGCTLNVGEVKVHISPRGCFLSPQKCSAFPHLKSQLLTSGFSFSAFEMTLTEGIKLEKKLFYSTFATVSKPHARGESHTVQPYAFLAFPYRFYH